jgi:chromosome segregation ATPase
MEEQRKFKLLKNRLKAMNYEYSFSLDSAALIEALLNDLSSLNQSLQKLRTQKPETDLTRDQEYPNREKYRLEDELERNRLEIKNYDDTESISYTIAQLRSENKILNQRLAGIQNMKIQSMDNKSKEYIDKLFTDCTFLRKQVEDTEENSQKLYYENRNLNDRLKSYEAQISNLKKELEITIATIKNITNENRSTTEEFYSLKQIISSYESKMALLNNESNGLRSEIQKLSQYNKSLEAQIISLRKENSKNINEVEMMSSSKTRLNTQIETLQRQLEILQNENNKLHSLREENRQSFLSAEGRLKDTELEFNGMQDKYRQLQRENQAHNETLRAKSEEIRVKEQMCKGYESEIKDLKVYFIKYEESLIENKKLKTNIEDLLFESKKLKQEIDEVKGNLKYKDEDSRQYRIYLEHANKDIESLKRKLEEESSKVEGYNISIRNNSFLEDQLKISKGQLDESMNRERQLHKEVENLRSMLSKSEEKIGFITRQLENAQLQKVSVEQDNTKLQKNLSECLARDNGKIIDISKLENRIQQYANEVDDLKRRISKDQDQYLSLQEDFKDCQKAYQNEQAYNARKNEQIGQLKDFIASLESSKNELLGKIEGYKNREGDHETFLKKMREENNQIKKQLGMSEKICNDGIEEKQIILKEIDHLKYDLGRRNDENLNLKNSLKIYMNELDDLKLKLKAAQDNEESFKRSWRDSEIERSRLNEINLSLNSQLEESKKTCNKLQMQIQEISKDYKYTSVELQKFEEKSKILSYEKDSISVRTEELAKEIRSKNDIISKISQEKDEIMQKFRIISEDYDKLVRAYDYLNLDFKKLSGKILASDNLNENLKNQEETYVRNISQLEEELRNALRNSEIADFKRQEAEKTSESLLKEVHSAKSISRDLDYSREDLHRKINTVETEKSFLETRCRAVENELSNLKSQLDYEKQRSLSLETRFVREKESFRRTEHEEERIKNFNQSNSDLVSELYKQIEAYKSDSLKVEIDYMKVMDELTRTKNMLHKADIRISELENSRR